MDEKPGEAVRAKRDSSLVVACRLVREGRADAEGKREPVGVRAALRGEAEVLDPEAERREEIEAHEDEKPVAEWRPEHGPGREGSGPGGRDAPAVTRVSLARAVEAVGDRHELVERVEEPRAHEEALAERTPVGVAGAVREGVVDTVDGLEDLRGEGEEQDAGGDAAEPVVGRAAEQVPVRCLVHDENENAVHHDRERKRCADGEPRMPAGGGGRQSWACRPHEPDAGREHEEREGDDERLHATQGRVDALLEQRLAGPRGPDIKSTPDALAVDARHDPLEHRKEGTAKRRDGHQRLPARSVRAWRRDGTLGRHSDSTLVMASSSSSASTNTTVAIWKGHAGPSAKITKMLPPRR